MKIQINADLSEDQENQRYSRLKKSLPQLAAASLAVYFSYRESSWRYVPTAALTSVAVFLTAKAVMTHSVETKEFCARKIDVGKIIDTKKFDTYKIIDLVIDSDSVNNMHRQINEEILRRERSHDFLGEYNRRERSRDLLGEYNFRELDFISRIDIELIYESELHKLASNRPMNDCDIMQMKEILSGNTDTVKHMVNECDHNGNTPLHNAVRSENLPAIKLLFEHGANCFMQNKKGETPYGLSSKSDLVQDLFQRCPSVKEKIMEQQYSRNINKLLNIPEIKSRLCNNPSSFQKMPNCEGVCSTLKELSVNKVLDSCRFAVS